MPSAASDLVSWLDVKPLAHAIFRVWTGGGDLAWAATAWAILGEQGLTETAPGRAELEELCVRARLLVVGELYHGFANAAWEEGAPSEWLDWTWEDRFLCDTDLLRELRPDFYAAFQEAIEVRDRSAEQDFRREVLEELMDDERTSVRAALLDGYGSTTALFVSLWLSTEPAYAGWRQFPDPLTNDVVNSFEFGDGKVPAWEWLTEGRSK